MRERKSFRQIDRDEGLEHRLMEDCFIDTIPNRRSDFIFMALRLCFFDGRFTAGSCLACLLGTHWLLASPDWFLVCSSDWLTDRSVSGYLCIYNFNTPTHSFRLLSLFSCLLNCDILCRTPNWLVDTQQYFVAMGEVLIQNWNLKTKIFFIF